MARWVCCCVIALTLAAFAFAQKAKKPAEPLKDFEQALAALRGGDERVVRLQRKRLYALMEEIVEPVDLVWALAARASTRVPEQDELLSDLRGDLGKRAVAALRKALDDKDRDRRLALAALLAQAGGDPLTNVGAWSRPAEKKREAAEETKLSRPILGPLADDIVKFHQKEEYPSVRRAALRALVALQPDADVLVGVFRLSLGSKDVAERQAVAALIGKIVASEQRLPPRYDQEPAAYLDGLAPLLGELTADADGKVRRTGLEAVGHVARALTLDLSTVLHLAEDHQPDEADAEGLKKWAEVLVGDLARLRKVADALNRSLSVAVKTLSDDDLESSLAAHKALERAATARLILRDKSAVLAAAKKDDTGAFFAAVPKSVAALTTSLSHKEARVRLAALYVLETMAADAADAAEALAKALADDDAFVRWGAARALRNLGPVGAAATPALAGALGDDHAEVRNAAAAALARYGKQAKGARAALVKALQQGDDKLRPLAARALGELGEEAVDARPALAAALSDEKAEVRAAAATALGKTGKLDFKTRTALVAATEDADDAVQVAAARALVAK